MIKRISLLIIFSVLLSIFTGFVRAEEREMGQEKAKLSISVDHVAGGLEKLKEKITLFFKFDKKQKSAYQRELVEKRLAELEYVIENKQWDFIEEVTSRYSTYVGHYINFIEKNKITDDKEQLLTFVDGHRILIEKMQTRFEYESGWWLSIQHNINVLKMSSEKVKAL